MFKIFLYILGVILISIGIFLTIIDLSVLTIGYTFLELGKFIIRRKEIYIIIIGIILIYYSFRKRG